MLPLLPIFLAIGLYTHIGCKLIQRNNSGKDSTPSNPPEEENEDGENNEKITIESSPEAIKYIKNQQKSSGQRNQADWGGERYGKLSNEFKRRKARY